MFVFGSIDAPLFILPLRSNSIDPSSMVHKVTEGVMLRDRDVDIRPCRDSFAHVDGTNCCSVVLEVPGLLHFNVNTIIPSPGIDQVTEGVMLEDCRSV